MAVLSPAGSAMLRRKLFVLSMVFLPFAASELKADVAQEAPKTTPQDPRSTTPDRRPGETLSERLDRNSGVIRPPTGVDPGIAVPVPDPNPGSTPVIPPPGTPGGDPSVQPK